MNEYIGHEHQIRGAERYVLQDGKGEGMHIIQVRNGIGTEIHISADRCADISRLMLGGVNLGFFSPCGYVAPSYYDKEQTEFLKSFTGGFMTTCGLTAVGTPCVDCGEVLPLHGTISNTPAVITACEENDEGVTIRAEIRDCRIFSRKLVMKREYFISYKENKIHLHDTITNEGDATSPIMILYHCNLGYPLISENTEVRVPHNRITPRNEHAAEGIDAALIMEKPQAGYEERCYYYDVKEKDGIASAGAYNDSVKAGVIISFDKSGLDRFVEWKMMGKTDYVLGLEPGNCTPDGRDVLRERGELKFLEPGEAYKTDVCFTLVSNKSDFDKAF